MSASSSTDSGKLRLEAHSEAQRQRILCAAGQCFVESGFHAASMASIAQTAGMSTGLIYRYFKNKHAIILAIIDQHLAEMQSEISALQAEAEVIAERIAARFQSWRSDQWMQLSPGLFQEIAALATRDPQVTDALRAADQEIRTQLSAWLTRAWRQTGCELSETAVAERVFLFQCYVEGLVLRFIKQPDTDLLELKHSLRPLLAHLLPITQQERMPGDHGKAHSNHSLKSSPALRQDQR